MKYSTIIFLSLALFSINCRKDNVDACDNKLIATIEDFKVFYNISGAFHFRAKFAIDADGSPRAYHPQDIGLDALEHAKTDGQWVGIVTDAQGKPVVQKQGDPYPGYYVSQTSLFDNRFAINDPLRYVNAEKVPYIVLPAELFQVSGAQVGDMAYVYNTLTKLGSYAIIADEGPEGLLGEGSIYLAQQIGIVNTSPRDGGITEGVIQYVVFPKSGKGNGVYRTNQDIETVGKTQMQKIGGMSKVLSCF